MKRFLYLTYHFPPIGGAAVQRSVQVVRQMPALGYEPSVVTGPGNPEYRWTPVDDDLRVPDTAIQRILGPEPDRNGVWAGRAERWLRRPQQWRRWWAEGVQRAARAAGDCDLVYATIAPYQAAEAAVASARLLGRPLVVDLEDPWALDEMLVYPTAVHRALERRRMGRTLAAADAVIMSTEEAAKAVREAFPPLAGKIVVAVPNRYDGQDFDGPPPARADGRFRIVHTGSLHTDLGMQQRRRGRWRVALGGTISGVDFLTRSHVFLLRALQQLERERPDLASHVEFHLAGVLTARDLEIARASRYVRLHGFLAHAETTSLMRSADLLFLPMHDVAAGARVRLVPQKTYEYIASGRPILAAVPDGDARDLLSEVGTAHLCSPADVTGMAEVIGTRVERWLAGEPPPAPRRDVVQRYESQRLATEVAAVFDRVLHERAVNATAVLRRETGPSGGAVRTLT